MAHKLTVANPLPTGVPNLVLPMIAPSTPNAPGPSMGMPVYPGQVVTLTDASFAMIPAGWFTTANSFGKVLVTDNGIIITNATPQSVSPNTGSHTGSTAVTITGTHFTGTTSVTFNGVAATSVVVVNSDSITCVTPAGTAGPVTIAVTNASGIAGTLTGGYTYT
jgi:IPT/TIG domain